MLWNFSSSQDLYCRYLWHLRHINHTAVQKSVFSVLGSVWCMNVQCLEWFMQCLGFSVLRSLCCVKYTAFSVLFSVLGVLCVVWMCNFQRALCSVPCSVFSILLALFTILWCVFLVQCDICMCSVQCSAWSVQCSMLCVLCFVFSVLYTCAVLRDLFQVSKS